MDQCPRQVCIEMLLVPSCYIETGYKCQPDGALGSYADFTITVPC